MSNEKLAAPKREDDIETRFLRDRFVPGLQRLPLNIVGGVAGGLAGKKMGGPVGSVTGMGLGSAASSAMQRHHVLNKLNNQYFGENADFKDKAKIHSMQLLNSAMGTAQVPIVPVTMALVTPEAVIQKKRRADIMNKQAFDLVNETFEKTAAKGKYARRRAAQEAREATMGVPVGSPVDHSAGHAAQAKAQVKDINKATTGTKLGNYNPDMVPAIAKPQSVVPVSQSTKGAVVGAGAGVGAGKKGLGTLGKAGLVGAGIAAAGATAYGLKKMHDNKQEKTAFDVVDEAYEKIAINKKDAGAAVLAAGIMTGSRKAASAQKQPTKQVSESVTAKSPDLKQAPKPKVGKAGKIGLAGKAGLAAAGVAAAGATAYGLKKMHDKKQEKTALDVVAEVFEKVAEGR